MEWSWGYIAQYIVEDIYGGYVNWNEEFFECPECGEPIYKCDYPMISIDIICPVCEASGEGLE